MSINDTATITGPYSPARTFLRKTFLAPDAVSVVYKMASKDLIVDYAKVDKAPKHHIIVEQQGKGQILETTHSDAGPCIFRSIALDPGATYTVSVHGLDDTTIGAARVSPPLTFVELLPPSQVVVVNRPDEVVVSFGSVEHAHRYTAEIVAGNGDALRQPVTATAKESPITLDATTLANNTNYGVRVWAELVNPKPME